MYLWLTPVPVLIKRAVNLAKGSAEPNKNRVAKISLKQVEEIAKIKMPDLNSFDMEGVMNQVKGTARSMGTNDLVVLFKHALPNAALPVVTIAGLSFGRLLGGTIIQNTLNDQLINNQTTINATVNTAGMLRALNFAEGLNNALSTAVAPR